MLLQNITLNAQYPMFFSGGVASTEMSTIIRNEAFLSRYANEASVYEGDSTPIGYSPGYAFFPPMKAGGMASNTDNSLGSGTMSNGNLAGGLNAQTTINGLGEITSAVGSLIIEMISTLSGTGAFASNPNLSGILQMLATIEASGGFVSLPELGAIVDCLCNIYGIADVSALLVAKGYMDATIYVNTGSADVAQMVNGIWDALGSDHNNPGTMGEKVNSAGTAGDPWTADLTEEYAEGTAGNIVGKKLLQTGKFIALK